MEQKVKLMKSDSWDELYTPKEAFDVLSPFLPVKATVFECAVGSGKLAGFLSQAGFNVVSSDSFFTEFPEYDVLVSNPPYSKKDAFLAEAYRRGKPFALLLPITALEGQKRQALYREYGVQILFPKKRIDFIGKGSPWFYTAWFTHGLNLPQQLNFN